VVVSVVVVVVCIKLGYTELIFYAEKRRRIFAVRASFRENWKSEEEISSRGNSLNNKNLFSLKTLLSLLSQHQPKEDKDVRRITQSFVRVVCVLRANGFVLMRTRFSARKYIEKIKYILPEPRAQTRERNRERDEKKLCGLCFSLSDVPL
jgi:hypothetical protein